MCLQGNNYLPFYVRPLYGLFSIISAARCNIAPQSPLPCDCEGILYLFLSFLCACCLLTYDHLDSAIKHCSANVLPCSRTGGVKIKIFISNNIEIKELLDEDSLFAVIFTPKDTKVTSAVLPLFRPLVYIHTLLVPIFCIKRRPNIFRFLSKYIRSHIKRNKYPAFIRRLFPPFCRFTTFLPILPIFII